MTTTQVQTNLECFQRDKREEGEDDGKNNSALEFQSQQDWNQKLLQLSTSFCKFKIKKKVA